jgi:hypothetical protein
MDHCQNHGIKSIHDDVESHCPLYAADLRAVSSLCTFVAGVLCFYCILVQAGVLKRFVTGNGNVNNSLKLWQETAGVSELAVVLANSTWWEGNDKVIKRFIALEGSLPQLCQLSEVQAMRNTVHDFLDPSFFVRLQDSKVSSVLYIFIVVSNSFTILISFLMR